MAEKRTLVVRRDQKFKHKRKGTIYTIKNVKGNAVVLVSENGKASMTIQMGALMSSEFEPIYD